jgi:ABC-type phosphate transport system substrate-binding protein
MKKIFLAVALIGMFSIGVMAQSYKVVVNNSNPVSSLTKKQVSNYLMKKAKKWDDGTIVSPVDQSANSAVRGSFSKDIHGKTTSAVKSYWQQAVFSGSGTPPSEKETDSQVLEYVKSKAGSIGYVSSEANTDGVKVIIIN